MNISYDYYRIFYYVANYGSFTRAAEILMNNQPNITRCIKNLESQLGTTLFLRSSKGVVLTDNGKKLFTHISAAVEHISAAEEELSLEKSLSMGTVSIGVSETALHGVLLPVINRFNGRYPGINIRISNHTTPQALAALKNGIADIAIVSTPAEISPPLCQQMCKTFIEIPVCGSRFSEIANKPLTFNELSNYPLISLGRDTGTYEFYNSFFLLRGILFKPDIEVATADQILPMVKNNLGIGFLPEPFAYDPIKNGEINEIQLSEELPKRSIILVKRSDHSLSSAARELEKMIIEFSER